MHARLYRNTLGFKRNLQETFMEDSINSQLHQFELWGT